MHIVYVTSINCLPSNNLEYQGKIISLSCGAGCGFSLFCFSIRNLVFVADIFIALMAGNNMKRMQTKVESINRNIQTHGRDILIMMVSNRHVTEKARFNKCSRNELHTSNLSFKSKKLKNCKMFINVLCSTVLDMGPFGSANCEVQQHETAKKLKP